MSTETIVPGLAEAANSIRSRFDIDKIIVFGSWATGEASEDSDIDLCILLNSREERLLAITRSIRLELFHRLNRSMDLLVYDTQTFQERREAGGALETAIARERVAV